MTENHTSFFSLADFSFPIGQSNLEIMGTTVHLLFLVINEPAGGTLYILNLVLIAAGIISFQIYTMPVL
jgi:hypothetical protein